MKGLNTEKMRSRIITGPDGYKEYQRESPWSRDHNDPDDVLMHKDSDMWTLTKVKCCQVYSLSLK